MIEFADKFSDQYDKILGVINGYISLKTWDTERLTDSPTLPPESVTYFVISDTIPKRSLPTALIINRLDTLLDVK